MKHLKMLGLAAMAVLGLAAWGASTASATELYSGATTLGVNTEIKVSLTKQTTTTLTTTDEKNLIDTCTSSEVAGIISNAGGKTSEGKHPSGPVSGLAFGNCSHTTEVEFFGSLEGRNVAGGTETTVISKNAQVTVLSTTFGLSCTAKTEGGTAIGTLGNGTNVVTVNAVIPTGFLCGGDARWKGSYTVTSPANLRSEAE